jgi:diguanylate cyclase (GGDEF)-like protein/PAS domain S-box-containing protein
MSRLLLRIPRTWARRVNDATDTLLYRLSILGVPVAVGALTLIALATWEPQYPSGREKVLDIRVLEQTDGPITPAQALAQLGASEPFSHYDIALSRSPHWFSFDVKPMGSAEPIQIELSSRHATETECWSSPALQPLGRAARSGSTGQMRAAKAGFVIDLGSAHAETAILCRAVFLGPARIAVTEWPEATFSASVEQFHRASGLLEGGLLVLSAFALLTAIITREWLYVLFSAWLIASLRLGALSAGWDIQWFERLVPLEMLIPARKLTVAVVFLLTYMLFKRLFRDDLGKVDPRGILSSVQWLSIVLLAGAVSLPFLSYLPFMWVIVVIGIAIMMYLLARILLLRRSRVAMWYAGSFLIVAAAGISEVAAASLGFKETISAVNSVTSALFSSLLVALAIAEHMREAREERLRAQATLRSTYEAIPIGLFTLDNDGRFARVNPALARMLGMDSTRDTQQCWRDHFEPGAWERLQETARRGAGQEIELRGAARVDQPPRWFFVKATQAEGHIEGSLQDITDRYNATERLRFLAENDPLTGVLNRRGIEMVLERATTELDDVRTLAVAYLDLDRFKLINDLFGHIAGDEVLKQVCTRTKRMLAHRHQIGRIGGDEFVIVFEETPIRLATAICRGIVELIGRSPYQISDKAFQVKGSIGLIEIRPGTSVKNAISMADRACREAKSGRHDGFVAYERNAPAFTDREREMRLIEPLGAGVVPPGLFLVMQPIMSLRAPYESMNFEVLLRMRENDGSITPASKIISAAENNGAVAVIDRWVLMNALAWLERHHERLPRTRFVCVNLSGGSLNDEKFVEDAFSMLAQHGRAVERLCIEITESVALHDLDNTKRFIHRIRDFGAKVALDDFGAGYTSFSYLKELPADAVKIDGGFITGVTSHPANLAIVQAIVELAANLGMKSIAEWVEDRPTAEALAHIGVDYVQGNAIGRPQNPETILLAESAASFIEDEQIKRYVRDSHTGAQTLESREVFGKRMDLH